MIPEPLTLAEFLQQQMDAHTPPLSPAELARRSGVKEPWLSRALRGKAVNPTARTICALARGVNSTPQDLIGPACRTATAGETGTE